MKTGNGYKPNPKGTFGGGMKTETSNVVKSSNGANFNAKKNVTAKKPSRSAKKA